METIRTQDIAVNDLTWKIEYHAERCTLCGSCVASCTFNALKVDVQRRSVTFSTGTEPNPVHEQQAIPVIKQKASIANACRHGQARSAKNPATFRGGASTINK